LIFITAGAPEIKSLRRLKTAVEPESSAPETSRTGNHGVAARLSGNY